MPIVGISGFDNSRNVGITFVFQGSLIVYGGSGEDLECYTLSGRVGAKKNAVISGREMDQAVMKLTARATRGRKNPIPAVKVDVQFRLGWWLNREQTFGTSGYPFMFRPAVPYA